MTVALTQLEPQIRIRCPGILVPVMDDAITRMVRKFFWESEVWKVTSVNGKDWVINTPALPTLSAGTDLPTATLVKRIDTLKYNTAGANWNQVIVFKTRDELDREIPQWESLTGEAPLAWMINSENDVIVVPIPTATQTTAMLLRAVIAPTSALTTLPDSLFYANEDTIRSGVLSDLLAIKGVDWTDTAEANKMSLRFAAGIKKAKSQAEAGFGQPKGTVSYGGL